MFFHGVSAFSGVKSLSVKAKMYYVRNFAVKCKLLYISALLKMPPSFRQGAFLVSR